MNADIEQVVKGHDASRLRRGRIRLFSSDLDNTLYGDPLRTTRFRDFWRLLPSEKRPLLCYNSGRLIDDQRDLVRNSELPEPDYLIGGVGTAIFDYRRQANVDDYQRSFHDTGWDVERVIAILRKTPGIEPQEDRYQTPFKSSWFLPDASNEDIAEIHARLATVGLQTKVIYSSDRDLDILPALADKGDALAWLCDHLGISTHETLVAGDTGNDSRMFQVPGVRGIVVGNARRELIEATKELPVYRAEANSADAVILGLLQFGIADGHSKEE